MSHRRAPRADSDLDDIWRYVAIHSGSYGIADRLIDSIVDRFLLLAANPYIGRPRDQDLRPGLRSFLVGEYVIFYRIENERIVILRVLHGSRDLPAFFPN